MFTLSSNKQKTRFRIRFHSVQISRKTPDQSYAYGYLLGSSNYWTHMSSFIPVRYIFVSAGHGTTSSTERRIVATPTPTATPRGRETTLGVPRLQTQGETEKPSNKHRRRHNNHSHTPHKHSVRGGQGKQREGHMKREPGARIIAETTIMCMGPLAPGVYVQYSGVCLGTGALE